jgi:hypothetical protein
MPADRRGVKPWSGQDRPVWRAVEELDGATAAGTLPQRKGSIEESVQGGS